MLRKAGLLLIVGFIAGCQKPAVEVKEAENKAAPPAEAPATAKAKLSQKSSTVASAGLGLRAAFGQIQGRLEESLAAGPSEVIWVIDVSKSAETLRGEAAEMIGHLHAGLEKKNEAADCLTGIVSAGAEAKWELEPAAAKSESLRETIGKLTTSSSPVENLFAAVKMASEKAVEARRSGREAMIVVITDEAGDDGESVDEVLRPLKKFGAPVYVIGNPAPFGRSSVSSASVESDEKNVSKIDPRIMHEGPETIEPEMVDLSFSGSEVFAELVDSGFGPFALEKLCRASGGKYLALRRSASELGTAGMLLRWPDPSAERFSAERMQAYAPEYGTVAEYRALLEANRAAKALNQAARLPRIETLGSVALHFEKMDEARMKRKLDDSQEAAAKVEPGVSRLVEILLSGEPDREKLPSARWKASYDLALGRALAAKARIDGYNNMLAILKRGRNFQKPQSKLWRLEASKDGSEAGSSIVSMIKKADLLLSRVIAEHPQTPWAELAKRELETPLGWKWVEE